MSANPIANGGVLLKELRLPALDRYALAVPEPGNTIAESASVQGKYIAGVMSENLEAANFRVFSPDENASNRWGALFDVTHRCSIPFQPTQTTFRQRDGSLRFSASISAKAGLRDIY